MKQHTRIVVPLIIVGALIGCSDNDDDNDNVIVDTSSQIPAFTYTGDNGPAFWADLSTDYAACGSDSQQSPVNVANAVADPLLEPLQLVLSPTDLTVENNGHNVEVPYSEGSSLTFKGITYNLLQFHFHTLTEHAVNGERSDLEMHAVFKDDSTGNYVVVGTLFDIGNENPAIAQLASNLPRTAGSSTETGLEINLADLMTDTSSYYNYAGSLTTPPCSSTVDWVVLTNNATISQTQWASFREIIGNNFRPLQSIGDRQVSITANQ